MAPAPIEESLSAAEAAVEAGQGLAGTGFWRAVSEVKRDPELVDRYAARIAVIDRRAFEQWALLKVPAAAGTVVMAVATLLGVVAIGWSYYLAGELGSVLSFYVGFGILLVTTHGLAHMVVGAVCGIGFTHWYIGTIWRPQPGVKVDYASYLRTSPRRRAWMHAAGAITTKLIPFALIGAAIAAGLPAWAVWLLPVIGVVSVVTDILWSTTQSDWKRFKREMTFVQDS